MNKKPLLIATFMIVVISVISQILPLEVSAKSDDDWLLYQDPRFDFSIQYPAGYQIVPRNDTNLDAMGTVLTFNLQERNKQKSSHWPPFGRI